MATQNPDQQWCGATLHEDMTRRRNALGVEGAVLSDARLSELAQALGIASLDQHLYELPLAARKRVSWLWPLAGGAPLTDTIPNRSAACKKFHHPCVGIRSRTFSWGRRAAGAQPGAPS